MSIESLLNDLPFMQQASPAARAEFLKQAVVQDVPPGATICWEGDTCAHLAIVLSGLVRVYKIGGSGREITLYRIQENDSCILTASCILSQISFPAIAVVEEPVRAVRPGYPAAVIPFLRDSLGFAPAWVVADIGAGTGILSEMFLKNGNPVYAVEPNEAMRTAAETRLADYPRLTCLDAAAEATALPLRAGRSQKCRHRCGVRQLLQLRVAS